MKQYDLQEAPVRVREAEQPKLVVREKRQGKKARAVYPKRPRPWLTLLAQACVLGVAVLSLYLAKWTGGPVTDAFLSGLQTAVIGEADAEPIRFTAEGGSRKCVIRAPFERFSFDVSGGNVRLVGLSAALRPCAAGVVTELGASGELNFAEIEHADGIRVRYYAASNFLIKKGEKVNRSTVLAPKGAFDPVLLQFFIEGKLCENVAVNANAEIECPL